MNVQSRTITSRNEFQNVIHKGNKIIADDILISNYNSLKDTLYTLNHNLDYTAYSTYVELLRLDKLFD